MPSAGLDGELALIGSAATEMGLSCLKYRIYIVERLVLVSDGSQHDDVPTLEAQMVTVLKATLP